MKYLALLAVVAVAYGFYTRQTPKNTEWEALDKPPAATASAPAIPSSPTATPTPRTNAYKRPLDRTNQVLGDVKKQNAENSF